LVDGAITCDREGAMEAVMMGSDKLEALSCKQWAGGVPIEAAEIPEGMTRGLVQIRVHGKQQWTSLRMIKKVGQ